MFNSTKIVNCCRFVSLFVLLAILPHRGQSQLNTLDLRGCVRDVADGAYLPFAGMQLTKSGRGTISNADGQFAMRIPQSLLKDTFLVSFIGYKTVKIAVAQMRDSFYTVWLEQKPLEISEVIVHPNAAIMLLKKALKKIPDNYPDFPQKQQAYYRETVKDNGQFTQYTELVLDIYKGAYTDKNDRDQLQIKQGRTADDMAYSPLWDYVFFVNGPYEALKCDVAKYHNDFIEIPQHRINFLNPKHFKYYDYQLQPPVTHGGGIYLITFKPAHRTAFFSGSIILDSESHAFLSVYYKIDDSQIDKAHIMKYETESYLYQQKINLKTVAYECLLNYKKQGDLWQFSHSRIFYRYIMYSPTKSILSDISNTSEMIVTHSTDENVEKLSFWKQLANNISMPDQLKSYNANFWEHYNVVDLENYERQLLINQLKNRADQ